MYRLVPVLHCLPMSGNTQELDEGRSYHNAREALLKQINAERINAGLAAVEWHEGAADVADAHCKAMVASGFSSQWDLSGQKPYQRYFFGGVRDHVVENFGGHDVEAGKAFLTDDAQVENQMQAVHASFMAEESPHDAHRTTVLDPCHTHVAIGVAVNKDHFRYIEVFLDRYVEFGPNVAAFDKVTGTEMLLTAKVLPQHKAADWGPYGCTVFYEPFPSALSAEDASAQDGYPDFADLQTCVVWPWEITRGPDNTFMIPLQFEEVNAGHYYVQIHVRRDAESIPYNEAQEGIDMPGEGTVVATGLVMTYEGPTLIPSDDVDEGAKQGGAADAYGRGSGNDKAITEVRVAEAHGHMGREGEGEGKTGPGDFESRTVVGSEVEGVKPRLKIEYMLSGEGDDTALPITDITLIHSIDPDVQPPAGFEAIRVDLGEACRSLGGGAGAAAGDGGGSFADEGKGQAGGEEGTDGGGEEGGADEGGVGPGAAAASAQDSEEAKVRERYNEHAMAKRDALKMMFEALDAQAPPGMGTGSPVLDLELAATVDRGSLAARLWEDEALRGVRVT